MSMGVVDTIMVGRMPDSAIAIGATGLGQSLYHVIVFLGAGLLLGMDTFVAQAYGRKDLQDAHKTLLNGIVLALVLTPILMIAVSFWPVLMRRFGVSVQLVGPMQPFLSALNWGTFHVPLTAVNVPPVAAYPDQLCEVFCVSGKGNGCLCGGELAFGAGRLPGSA